MSNLNGAFVTFTKVVKKYYDTNEGTFEGTRYEGTKLLRVKKITTKVQQIYYEGTKVRRYKITTKVLNLTFV